MSSPTYDEIRRVARRAIDIFATFQLKCCLVGSAACALYGNERCPNDVDLVVFTSQDQEYLKRILSAVDSNFYLVNSRARFATYKVLWYRLGRMRRCKVDILRPGTLEVPDVPRQYIKQSDGLPVMPLLPLLLLKLKGWTDHRESHRSDMQAKQYVDVDDIEKLLWTACSSGATLMSQGLEWMPDGFVRSAKLRVAEYVDEYRDTSERWRSLGFDV